MSTISHQPNAVQDRSGWSVRILVPEMWAALSIAVMWLTVLFAAIFGPDFVASSNDGNSTTIPSAVLLAILAYLGTRAVAKYGFGSRPDTTR